MDWVGRIRWAMVTAALALVAIGVAVIVSATDTDLRHGFGQKQLIWTGVSLVVMLLVAAPSYLHIRRFAYAFFLATLPLLVLVLFLEPIKGARRWIRLPMFHLQPSELVKIAYICALGKYLMFRKSYRTLKGLVGPLLLTLVPMLLILRQPDLGTALVFLPVLYAMLFAAGARVRHLVIVAMLGLVCLAPLYLVMSHEQRSRITAWVGQKDVGAYPRHEGYQLYMSKIALGSGGLFGKGFRRGSWTRMGYVPEDHTDFVFSVIGEEWGLAGCAVTLGLYVVIFASGLQAAAGTREPFGRLVAVGIVVLLAAQLIINAGMTVGLMPITGMTLPFVSYGGSSLVSSFVALGLLLNIAMRKPMIMYDEPFEFSD